MASNTKFSVAARNAALDAIMALWLPSGEFGFIELRTGAPAADCESAPAGTLLCQVFIHQTTFPAASNGSTAFAVAESGGGVAAGGTAAHFELRAENVGDVVMQGTVDTAGNSPDIAIENQPMTAGETIYLYQNDLTFTLAE